MIYLSNNEFRVFPYKATYNEKEEFVTDKEQFERDLLEHLRMEEEHKAFEENREPKEVKLPEIEYIEVKLTDEQQERFNEVKTLPDITLDEVNNYVVHNQEPKAPSFHIQKLKNEDLLNKEAIADLYVMGLSGDLGL